MRGQICTSKRNNLIFRLHRRDSADVSTSLLLSSSDHVTIHLGGYNCSVCAYHDAYSWNCTMQGNIWRTIYLNCGERYEDMIDHCSYIHNLSSCEINPRTCRDRGGWMPPPITFFQCFEKAIYSKELKISEAVHSSSAKRLICQLYFHF